MEKFEVVKGIPMPERVGRGGGRVKYPLAAMEIGDSFFVPVADGDKATKQKRNSISSSAKRLRPKRFLTRLADLGEQHGIRVWRSQ